jgi:signal peptidase I
MAEVEITEQPAQPGLWSRWNQISREVHRGFVAEWAVTIILLLFATTTLVQAFVIPSASMENTLLIGDHVLVDKLTFAPAGTVSQHLLPYRDVRRGDIIVFRYPLNIKEDYVKRAIGVPGDHIRLVNKQLMLNGHLVNEPYVIHRTSYLDSYRDNFPVSPDPMLPASAVDMLQNHVTDGEVVVPAGHVFAMGDNRDDSLDSRYWGFVPRENIVGRPLFVYWSFITPEENEDRTSMGDRVQQFGHVLVHFFDQTRWRRTFHLVR